MVGSLYWTSLITRLDRGREYGMGFWKNLRAGAAFMREYQQDAMETLPRWARVVRVGRQVLGTVGVDVEIHYGRAPSHVESVSVSVPRGMQLQVGQDVFVVGPATSNDSSDTTWILDVTRPPQYGSWPTPPEFLRNAPPGAASPWPRRRICVSRGSRSCRSTCGRGRSRRKSTSSTCGR